jgi:hypothetical protein
MTLQVSIEFARAVAFGYNREVGKNATKLEYDGGTGMNLRYPGNPVIESAAVIEG